MSTESEILKRDFTSAIKRSITFSNVLYSSFQKTTSIASRVYDGSKESFLKAALSIENDAGMRSFREYKMYFLLDSLVFALGRKFDELSCVVITHYTYALVKISRQGIPSNVQVSVLNLEISQLLDEVPSSLSALTVEDAYNKILSSKKVPSSDIDNGNAINLMDTGSRRNEDRPSQLYSVDKHTNESKNANYFSNLYDNLFTRLSSVFTKPKND